MRANPTWPLTVVTHILRAAWSRVRRTLTVLGFEIKGCPRSPSWGASRCCLRNICWEAWRVFLLLRPDVPDGGALGAQRGSGEALPAEGH